VTDERVSKYLDEMEALDKQEAKAEATRELEEKLKKRTKNIKNLIPIIYRSG
jgi:hypothetical protein